MIDSDLDEGDKLVGVFLFKQQFKILGYNLPIMLYNDCLLGRLNIKSIVYDERRLNDL